MSRPSKFSRMLNRHPSNSTISQALHVVRNNRGSRTSSSHGNAGRWTDVRQPHAGTEANQEMMDVEEHSEPTRNTRTFTLGYKRLEELANVAENNEVVVFLANSRNGFEEFIQKDLNIDKLILVFKVLKKASKSDYRENIASVLIQACNQKFLDQILNKISMAEIREPTRVPGLVEDMLVFFDTTISLVPNLSCDRLSHIVAGCQGILARSVRVTLPTGTLEKFESMQNQIVHLMEKKTEAEIAKESKKDLLKYRAPPNDFREMSLYPNLEDIVGSSRPFLRPNLVEGRYLNVEHYLDVQFRLMHEDVFRPLREGITLYRRGEQKSKGDSSIKTYENVRFLNSELKDGVQEGTRVFFDPLKKMTNVDWELSKRFIHGALLCFTKDDFKSIICATILNRDVNKELKKGILSVEFCDIYEENIYKTPYLMIESEVFYEPYLQVMKTLQSMGEHSFPMQKYIVDVQAHDDVPPYLLANTNYQVSGMAGGDFTIPVLSTGLWPSAEQLGLDPSQHRALQAALTREMVVIQGPPGTGKTYMGLKIAEILIKNKQITSPNKPLLVVCLTNHALDQFLMGIAKCTKNLIRIGGQSRCEEMAQFNLKFRRTSAPRTQTAKQLRSNIYQEKAIVTSALEKLKNNLSSVKSVGILTLRSLRRNGVLPEEIDYQLKSEANYLEWLTQRKSYSETVNVGDLQFTSTIAEIQEQISVVVHQEKNEELRYAKVQSLEGHMESLLQELQNDESEVDARLIHQWSQRNVLHLDVARKWQLYRSWVANLKDQWQQELRALETQYSRLKQRLDEVQMVEDLEIMRHSDVIGMTTNGAARLHSMLSKLGPQIVIVEEAAEVLEAHVVACLSSQCQHLILIGDHKQLRPNTAVYALARHLNFDVSLFERMVRNRGQCETLIVQHRMSPVLATLIVPTVYKYLENHPSVLEFPEINGIPQRLFFLTHSKPEKQDSELSSRTNDFEAKFVLALCRHLVLQGYPTSQITALATYKGQMFLMKKLQREMSLLQGMQVTVVDNFQGEENTIIVLSLVRSNNENKIGYLATENRMCVALSRARHALYMVGNMQCLAEASDVWKSVQATLIKHKAIGTALTLRCQIHPEQFSEVSCAKDFDVKSPEGGCTEMCMSMLACGHMCNTVCHSLNRNHENIRCYHACDRICANLLHKCNKKCFENCGDCKVKVLKDLPCEHQAVLPCYFDPSKYICKVEVEKTFIDCNHTATVECNVNPAKDQCPKKCENRVDCGHKCGLKCHVNKDPEHIEYVCRRPCGRYNLNCSTQTHECGKLCFETCNPCSVIVEKKRQKCGHKFRLPCSEDPEPVFCSQKCKRSLPCGHFCKEKCGNPCKCYVNVTKVIESCGHEVKVECHVEATRKICRKKCELELSCGHPCSNLCCQPCSTKCEAEAGTASGACGHQVPLLCWEKQARVVVIGELDRCRGPCGVMLECKHPCPGTCGSCFQGRIHQLCSEPCGKPLVCGHSCTQLCNAACVPCNKPCEYRCKHSQCDRKCGEPCAKCIEPCEWKCSHMKCKKRCWEPCTTCKESCKLKLACGHPCVGLCGEPCPPLCRVCNFEELTELFLGYEDEEDARFVYLEECGHTIECRGLDTWLGQDGGEINIKACPRCKTAITNVPHCCSAVKQAYADFAVVKVKNFGRVEEIEVSRQQLEREATALLHQCNISSPPRLRRCIEGLVAALAPTQGKRRNTFNAKTINIKEIHLNIVSNISAMWLKVPNFNTANTGTLVAQCSFLLDAVEAKKLHLGMQQVTDFNLELQRLKRIFQVVEIKQRITNIGFMYAASELATFETFVVNSLTRRYSTDKNQQAQQLYDIVINKLNQQVPGLGISQLEFLEMKNAIPSIAATKWYKCRCGFIYAVGNCGQLNESSKCPDCSLGIGGGAQGTSTVTNFPM